MPSRARDATAAGLVAAAVLWTLLTTSGSFSGLLRFDAALAVAVVGYIVGRWAGARADPGWVPLAGLLAGGWVVLATTVGGRVSGGGLGYVNASAALAVQALAAVSLLTVQEQPLLRRVGGVACVLLAGAVVMLQSLTGILVAGLVLAAAFGPAPGPAARRWALPAATAVVLGTVLLPVLAVARYAGNGFAAAPGVVTELSQRRLELWADAVRLAAEHPLTGVGVGSFAAFSPTAGLDGDTRAAHSLLLEVAAEQGVVVAALLAGALVLLLAGALGGAGRPAAVGGAALTAWLLHAGVDYVADFPVVTAMAAVVTGACTAAGARVRECGPAPLRTAPRPRG